MLSTSPVTETLLDEGRKLLEAYDDAMKSQKMNGSGSNACLIVMANYGDLALGLLRGILTSDLAQTPDQGCGTPGCIDPHCNYGKEESDFERVFQAACDEIGCKYDNEALLQAIHDLKARVSDTSTLQNIEGK